MEHNIAKTVRRQKKGTSVSLSGGDSPYRSDLSCHDSDTADSEGEEEMDTYTHEGSAVRMPAPHSIARGIARGRSEAACSEAYPP